ncbi:uncharacterized protein V1518DRAFT_415277 [Limtongia smithiae]|uniref:uncharacterized protein n=1 Tax=Limtongia smithiae TaxID=1125753 RepID=UPI0034CDA387
MVARKGRLTGLQREVLSLYRSSIRAIRTKPPENRANFVAFVRSQFRPHLALSKSDFATIEYLLRKGSHQLETYSNPGVRNVSV